MNIKITLLFAMSFILLMAVITFLLYKRIGKWSINEHSSEEENEPSDLDEKKFGENEIGDLVHSFKSMETALTKQMHNVAQITADRERISAELNIAANIQVGMLPKDFLENDKFTIYAQMTPAKEVGGDFYDYFMIDDDHLGLVMADVSGKGVPAAMFMVIAKTLIKIRTTAPGTPKDILYDVNNTLCENNNAGLFVTVWFGILTLSTRELISANAGHEYPAIKRNGEDFILDIDDHCPPLAAMEEMEFENTVVKLEPGDELFLYTDGVPEAKNAQGDRFETDRMIEVLNKYKELEPEDALKNIKQEIDDFVGDCDPFDDVTMLMIKLND